MKCWLVCVRLLEFPPFTCIVGWCPPSWFYLCRTISVCKSCRCYLKTPMSGHMTGVDQSDRHTLFHHHNIVKVCSHQVRCHLGEPRPQLVRLYWTGVQSSWVEWSHTRMCWWRVEDVLKTVLIGLDVMVHHEGFEHIKTVVLTTRAYTCLYDLNMISHIVLEHAAQNGHTDNSFLYVPIYSYMTLCVLLHVLLCWNTTSHIML